LLGFFFGSEERGDLFPLKIGQFSVIYIQVDKTPVNTLNSKLLNVNFLIFADMLSPHVRVPIIHPTPSVCMANCSA
jgi:hypothetical protein